MNNNKKNRFWTGAVVGFLMLMAGCAEGPDRDIEYRLFVTHPTLNMMVGEQVQITASPTNQTFTWETTNSAIASVSQGLVTALGDGACIVIVTSSGGLRREIPVSVADE